MSQKTIKKSNKENFGLGQLRVLNGALNRCSNHTSDLNFVYIFVETAGPLPIFTGNCFYHKNVGIFILLFFNN